jgi:solute carrier family 25 (mitochondrial phosphate transporter), member 3
VNEFCHELAFRNMSEETRRNLSATAKFSVSLGSGIIAGFAAAILSQVRGCPVPPEPYHHRTLRWCGYTMRLQPADTLLSQINKGHGPTGSMPHRLKVLAQEAGFKGLFAGLGPRMVMTAGLVAGQFLMYGAIKDGTWRHHLRQHVELTG